VAISPGSIGFSLWCVRRTQFEIREKQEWGWLPLRGNHRLKSVLPNADRQKSVTISPGSIGFSLWCVRRTQFEIGGKQEWGWLPLRGNHRLKSVLPNADRQKSVTISPGSIGFSLWCVRRTQFEIGGKQMRDRLPLRGNHRLKSVLPNTDRLKSVLLNTDRLKSVAISPGSIGFSLWCVRRTQFKIGGKQERDRLPLRGNHRLKSVLPKTHRLKSVLPNADRLKSVLPNTHRLKSVLPKNRQTKVCATKNRQTEVRANRYPLARG